MTSKYWQKYNLNKTKLIKKITKYNRKNNVNFIESGHYNHTRDILALSISLIFFTIFAAWKTKLLLFIFLKFFNLIPLLPPLAKITAKIFFPPITLIYMLLGRSLLEILYFF